MKNFKNYQPRGASGNASGYTGGGVDNGNSDGNGTVAELTKKLAETFNGQPTGAMLKSILREAEEKNRAGLLTNAEIDAFYEQFSPMLNAQQRATLKNVVERLKAI